MLKKLLLTAALLIGIGGAAFAQPVQNPQVLMETSKGNIRIELYAKDAPISVENFLTYVRKGFYDGTIFHRVIREFMIQGGGFTPDLTQKPVQAPIRNEAVNGLKNRRGTVAMARTGVVDSATAQFFINTVDNPFLDHRNTSSSGYGYAVFGRVVDGMDVVDRIARARKSYSPGFDDLPAETVLIRHVRILDR